MGSRSPQDNNRSGRSSRRRSHRRRDYSDSRSRTHSRSRKSYR